MLSFFSLSIYTQIVCHKEYLPVLLVKPKTCPDNLTELSQVIWLRLNHRLTIFYDPFSLTSLKE